MDISKNCEKCTKLAVCFAFRKLATTINEIDSSRAIFHIGSFGADSFKEKVHFILADSCSQYKAKKEKYV